MLCTGIAGCIFISFICFYYLFCLSNFLQKLHVLYVCCALVVLSVRAPFVRLVLCLCRSCVVYCQLYCLFYFILFLFNYFVCIIFVLLCVNFFLPNFFCSSCALCMCAVALVVLSVCALLVCDCVCLCRARGSCVVYCQLHFLFCLFIYCLFIYFVCVRFFVLF